MQNSLMAFKTEMATYLVDFHDTGMRTPKFHILEHYTWFILQFGSLLNGDTETTEGTHTIVKQSYRVTNKNG